MPSPEQGASTATTSNHASKSQTARGSQVVTTTLPVPHLRTLSASTAARRRSISLATTSPSGPASEGVERRLAARSGAEVQHTRTAYRRAVEQVSDRLRRRLLHVVGPGVEVAVEGELRPRSEVKAPGAPGNPSRDVEPAAGRAVSPSRKTPRSRRPRKTRTHRIRPAVSQRPRPPGEHFGKQLREPVRPRLRGVQAHGDRRRRVERPHRARPSAVPRSRNTRSTNFGGSSMLFSGRFQRIEARANLIQHRGVRDEILVVLVHDEHLAVVVVFDPVVVLVVEPLEVQARRCSSRIRGPACGSAR